MNLRNAFASFVTFTSDLSTAFLKAVDGDAEDVTLWSHVLIFMLQLIFSPKFVYERSD